ncbi:hypothetical protein CSC02_1789 [Enterobacter hormaechei subsp. hoffmannii]|nr:hypothetical protein CSC02_1789 [Enterobacter hormaechei subsp. hoffmannii]
MIKHINSFLLKYYNSRAWKAINNQIDNIFIISQKRYSNQN